MKAKDTARATDKEMKRGDTLGENPVVFVDQISKNEN